MKLILKPEKFPPFTGTYYRLVSEKTDDILRTVFDHLMDTLHFVDDGPEGLPAHLLEEFKALAFIHNVKVIIEMD